MLSRKRLARSALPLYESQLSFSGGRGGCAREWVGHSSHERREIEFELNCVWWDRFVGFLWTTSNFLLPFAFVGWGGEGRGVRGGDVVVQRYPSCKSIYSERRRKLLYVRSYTRESERLNSSAPCDTALCTFSLFQDEDPVKFSLTELRLSDRGKLLLFYFFIV